AFSAFRTRCRAALEDSPAGLSSRTIPSISRPCLRRATIVACLVRLLAVGIFPVLFDRIRDNSIKALGFTFGRVLDEAQIRHGAQSQPLAKLPLQEPPGSAQAFEHLGGAT